MSANIRTIEGLPSILSANISEGDYLLIADDTFSSTNKLSIGGLKTYLNISGSTVDASTLSAELSNYSTTTAINSLLSTELSNYSTTTAINSLLSTELSNYSTTTAINSLLSTELSNYSTTTAINTALDSHVDKSSNQTISGEKTFSDVVVVGGVPLVNLQAKISIGGETYVQSIVPPLVVNGQPVFILEGPPPKYFWKTSDGKFVTTEIAPTDGDDSNNLGIGAEIISDSGNETFADVAANVNSVNDEVIDLSNVSEPSIFNDTVEFTDEATFDSISNVHFSNGDTLDQILNTYIDNTELQSAISAIDYSNFVELGSSQSNSSQSIYGIKTFQDRLIIQDSNSDLQFSTGMRVFSSFGTDYLSASDTEPDKSGLAERIDLNAVDNGSGKFGPNEFSAHASPTFGVWSYSGEDIGDGGLTDESIEGSKNAIIQRTSFKYFNPYSIPRSVVAIDISGATTLDLNFTIYDEDQDASDFVLISLNEPDPASFKAALTAALAPLVDSSNSPRYIIKTMGSDGIDNPNRPYIVHAKGKDIVFSKEGGSAIVDTNRSDWVYQPRQPNYPGGVSHIFSMDHSYGNFQFRPVGQSGNSYNFDCTSLMIDHSGRVGIGSRVNPIAETNEDDYDEGYGILQKLPSKFCVRGENSSSIPSVEILGGDLVFDSTADYSFKYRVPQGATDPVLVNSSDFTNIIEVSPSNSFVDWDWHNRVIHFVGGSDQVVKLPEGADSDYWVGFKCKIFNLGTDSKIQFDFFLNGEEDQEIPIKYGSIELYYSGSEWLAFGSGGGASLSGQSVYSIQLLGENPMIGEADGAVLEDPGARIKLNGEIVEDIPAVSWPSVSSEADHTIQYSYAILNSSEVKQVSRVLKYQDVTAPIVSHNFTAFLASTHSDNLSLDPMSIFDGTFTSDEDCQIYLKFVNQGSGPNFPIDSSENITYAYAGGALSSTFGNFSLPSGDFKISFYAEDAKENETDDFLSDAFNVAPAPYDLTAPNDLLIRFFGWNSNGPNDHPATSAGSEVTRASGNFVGNGIVETHPFAAKGLGTTKGLIDPVSGLKAWRIGESSIATEVLGSRECVKFDGSDVYYIHDLHDEYDPLGDFADIFNGAGGDSPRTICFWYKPERNDDHIHHRIFKSGILSDQGWVMDEDGVQEFIVNYSYAVDGSGSYALPFFTPGSNMAINKVGSRRDDEKSLRDQVDGLGENTMMFCAIVYDGGDLQGGSEENPSSFKFFHGIEGGDSKSFGFGSGSPAEDHQVRYRGANWREFPLNSGTAVNEINTRLRYLFFGGSYNGVGEVYDNCFKGHLHDFRLYGTDLSEAQVLSIFNDTEEPQSP